MLGVHRNNVDTGVLSGNIVNTARKEKFSLGRLLKVMPVALLTIASSNAPVASAGPTPYTLCLAACGAASLATAATPACPASYTVFLTCCNACLPLLVVPTP